MSINSSVTTSVEELLGLRVEASRLLRTTRKRVHRQRTGPRASRSLGRGLDFAESRIYQPGDDVRNMDWNVTARSGVAHSKLFVEEREKPTLLLVDLTPGMWFATRGMFKSLLVTRIAALLAWCAVAGNDRVGGIVTTGEWQREVPAEPGRRGVMALIRYLVDAREHRDTDIQEATSSSADVATEQFTHSLQQLQKLSRAGGDVVVLSDFASLDSATADSASIDRQNHYPSGNLRSPVQTRLASLAGSASLTLVHVFDPIEKSLPVGGRLDVVKQGVRAQLAQGTQPRQQHTERFAARTDALQSLAAANGRVGLLQVNTAEQPVDALQRLLQRAQ